MKYKNYRWHQATLRATISGGERFENTADRHTLPDDLGYGGQAGPGRASSLAAGPRHCIVPDTTAK